MAYWCKIQIIWDSGRKKASIHYPFFSSVNTAVSYWRWSCLWTMCTCFCYEVGTQRFELTLDNVGLSSRNDQHPSCCLRNVLRGSAYEEVQDGHHGSCQVCTGNISVGLLPLSVLLCLGLWECQSGWYHCVIWWVCNLITWIFKTVKQWAS